MRDEVYDFFVQTAREMAADDAMEGEETLGYKEVNRILEKSLDKLGEMFEVEETKPKVNLAK